MTDYDLFPATSGPAVPASYGGPFTAAACFGVRGGGKWFRGYKWWVCPSGQVTSATFALWSAKSSGTGGLIPSATVSATGLTPGQWNNVLLADPVPLSPSLDPANHANGSAYVACAGFTGNFPDTAGFWSAPVSNGPLTAYAGGGGSNAPYGLGQGLFSSASSDPTSAMPANTSGTDNFWISPIIGDTPPPGYAGPLRLWPNKADGSPLLTGDTSVAGGYTDATEFHLTVPATMDRIWFYSPPGSAALPASARVRRITGTATGLLVSDAGTPSWSGAPGSGWVWTAMDGALLPAGSYKASVYCSDGTSLPKDAFSGYFTAGAGSGGIDWGGLSAPDAAGASLAYVYNTGGGGNTPAWTDGATVKAGQSTFARGGEGYAYLYADGLGEWYTVDPQVTLQRASGLLMAGSGVVA